MNSLAVGITPAYAGKTYFLFVTTLLMWDHPRLRGKDDYFEIERLYGLESPPLTRERPDKITISKLRIGITPAYAGKTCTLYCSGYLKKNHPRSRGKDCTTPYLQIKKQGSPPLTRERLQRPEYIGGRSGITPAHAGKTLS